MASFLYDECRQSIGGNPTHSVIDFHDDTLKAHFIDSGSVTVNQTSNVDQADHTTTYPAYASCPSITNNDWTVSSNIGYLDDDGTDLTFTALDTSSNSCESVEYWKEGGTAATSPLISHHDDYTGLPVTGTGGDVTIVFPATGILRI
jgi:hypothetical protein